MNRSVKGVIGASRSVVAPRISSEAERKHRSFKEMIKWRKEREQKERLARNKVIWQKLRLTFYFLRNSWIL